MYPHANIWKTRTLTNMRMQENSDTTRASGYGLKQIYRFAIITLNWCKRNLFNVGCFPFCQRFRKFRSEFKWKGPFRFLPTGLFGITSGGGPLISVGIIRSKFAVPFLTNRFFALIREFGKGIKSGKSHSYWLARFNRKISFHFPRVFPLISDESVWDNERTVDYSSTFPTPPHHFLASGLMN